jgi:5'(3')-deoxyribonucleotidase
VHEVGAMRILVDVDGVCADFVELYLNRLNRITGRNHVPADITCFDFSQCIASKREDEQVWDAFRDGDVERLNAYPGTTRALKALRTLGEVVAVTAPAFHHDAWVPERYRWLLRRGFDRNTVVFTHNKAIVCGSCLLDDSLTNIEDWCAANPSGFGLLLTRPWNQGKIEATNGLRVGNMQKAIEIASMQKAIEIASTLV